MKFYRSIQFRLVILNISIVLTLLLVFGSIAYFMLSHNLNENMDESLRAVAIDMEASVTLENQQLIYSGRVIDLAIIYDSNSKLVQKVGPNVDFTNITDLVNSALLGDRVFINDTSIDNQDVRLYAAPLTIQGNRFALIVGRSTTEINDLLAQYKQLMWIAGLGMLILAGGAGYFLSNRSLKTVDNMTNVAKEISEKDLKQRIPVVRDDEMGRLATTLNQMIERLEFAFKRQRQFTADASHELRTPLSIIRGESGLALSTERTGEEYRKSLDVIEQESKHMSAIIDKLLFLARSDSGKEPLNLQKFDLKELINEISVDILVLTQEKGIHFKIELEDDIVINADKVKVRQLIVCLLDNAIKYTAKAGMISVTLARKKQNAVIEVADTGIGIPAEHLPYIFDRFYRVDKAHARSEGGVGLGLSIAKTITDAHKGTIEVESQYDKGSKFKVTLPILKNLNN